MTASTKTPQAPSATPPMPVSAAPITTGETLPALTLADRCESCNQPGQSAWKMTAATVAPLVFCGHHTRRFVGGLRSSKPHASLINPGIIA